MRLWLVLLLLAVAPLALADRLLTIPTARKLLDGSLRFESLRRLDRLGTGTDYLATAFGNGYEAEARLLHRRGDDRATLDLTYNVVAAIPGFSPGIALGVQDLADQTRPGARLFGLFTNRVEFGAGNVPFDVTVGLFVGRRVTPFVGAAVPLYAGLRLLAEHDGDMGRVGLEATPLRGLRARLVEGNGDLLGSLGYTVKF